MVRRLYRGKRRRARRLRCGTAAPEGEGQEGRLSEAPTDGPLGEPPYLIAAWWRGRWSQLPSAHRWHWNTGRHDLDGGAADALDHHPELLAARLGEELVGVRRDVEPRVGRDSVLMRDGRAAILEHHRGADRAGECGGVAPRGRTSRRRGCRPVHLRPSPSACPWSRQGCCALPATWPPSGRATTSRARR